MSDAYGNSTKGTFKEAFSLMNLVGIIIGAISAANIIMKISHSGVNPALADIMATYRWLFHDVILGFLANILHLSIPAWLKDVIVCWSIMSAIAFRTLRHAAEMARRSAIPRGEIERAVFVALPQLLFPPLAFVFCVLFWPVLFLRFGYAHQFSIFHRSVGFGREYDGDDPPCVIQRISVWIIGIAMAALLPALYYSVSFIWMAPLIILIVAGTLLFALPFYGRTHRTNYRTIWFMQILTMLTLISLLLVANAGLPVPQLPHSSALSSLPSKSTTPSATPSLC